MKVPCQALVVRFAPNANSGEALNIGVVLVCSERAFLGARFASSLERVKAAFNADVVVLRRVGKAFEKACEDAVSQLPGLTPVNDVVALARSAVRLEEGPIQLSGVISGITADPQRTLDELFRQYVVDKRVGKRPRRADDAVWRTFAKSVPPDVRLYLKDRVLEAHNVQLRLDHAWQNGAWKAAIPLSLDMRDPESIREKVMRWSGRLQTVRPWEGDTHIYLLLGEPSASSAQAVLQAAQDAKAILDENFADHSDYIESIEEKDSRKLAEQIATDVRSRIRGERI